MAVAAAVVVLAAAVVAAGASHHHEGYEGHDDQCPHGDSGDDEDYRKMTAVTLAMLAFYRY